MREEKSRVADCLKEKSHGGETQRGIETWRGVREGVNPREKTVGDLEWG